jgi:hypothetical protein
MCNCINELEKLIKEKYGSGAHFTNVKMMFNFKSGVVSHVVSPLEFKYRVKKKDGTFSAKWQTSSISGSYCPHCGENKNQDAPQNTSEAVENCA